MARFLAILLVALLGFMTLIGPANADEQRRVWQTFRGQILLTSGELEPPSGDVKATVASYKKQALSTVIGESLENVHHWRFRCNAFLDSEPRNSRLKLVFLGLNGRKRLVPVADKQFDGCDPQSVIFSSEITINEDEGIVRGNRYTVKLVSVAKGEERVLATGHLMLQ